MKYTRRLVYLLVIIIFIISSLEVKAEDVNLVSFESLLGSKFTSTTQGSFTNAGGSRKSSTYGIRISLVLLDGNNPVTKKVYDVFTSYDDNHKVNSKQNKLNTYTKYKSQTGNLKNLNASVVTKTGENWNLDFRKIKEELANIKSKSEKTVSGKMKVAEFMKEINETSYYKLIMELVDDNSSLKKEFECTTTNKKNCSKANIKNYIDNVLNKIYILVEPISTVAFGSSNAWKGDIPLSDNEIKKIKDIGKFDSEYKNNDKDKLDELFIYLGLMDNAYFKDKLRPLYYSGICSSSDSAACRSYAYGLNSYIGDWNKLVDQVNNISVTYYTGTSTNIANKVLDSYNSDSTKKLRGISKKGNLQGSLEENVGRISEYFYGENININFPKFTKNTNTRSWKALTNQDYSLGIQILHGSFNIIITDIDMCSYEDGELSVPNGKDDEYCCNEMENDIPIWDDYKDGKSEQWQKFSKSDLYKKICPVEIKDNYCVWNGNNTERYQTVNGNELDCCTYENWGNTNIEREQALKKANKNKTVTKYVFENETTWYSNTCAVPVPQYCTIQKLQNGDTSCCHGLGNYSPSFKDDIKSNGYLVNEAGLQEYLKYKIGVNKYNKLCGAPCSYEIESVCPSCENEDTSYGLVMDKVSGFDSTALQLSKETEKCIFNNNDYLYENNSYCKIYCTEKVEYSLPKRSTLSVTAGTRLVVGGNLSPVESKTTITCRRSEIDTKKFESDLASKISTLKAAYKEYTYASVPLNENKINTTVIGVSKTDTRCECRNYQSGLVDGKCCDSKATHTIKATLTKTTTFAATDSVQYDYSAPTSSSSCSVQGGNWHDAVYEPKDSCGGGSDCFTKKGNCKAKCKTTIPVKVSDAYCSEYSPRQYCRSGFSLSGGTCVTTSSTANCSLSGNTWTCKDYSCSSTTSIGSETGKLTSASSFRTTDSIPTCSYAYCSNRNYDRYDFQTVDSYDYAYNKSATQGYQGKICENESGYYQTKYESLKEAKKEILLAAWNDYNSVINTLNMCYNFTDRVKSNYKININLSYQNGSYSIDTLLDSSVSQGSDKNFTQTVSTGGYKNCGTMTGVDFLNCEQETQYYTENINGTYAAGTSTNTYTYKLPNNSSMYRYVNKSSLSEKDSNINSIYIGPHLPVAYNEKDNKIEVELTPSVVRTNTSGTIYITKTRNDFESEICTDPYKCDAVTPGKTKIVPVYRVIALDSPFPDEDGNGRLTGRNWCSENDCSNTNPVVQEVITNNRGVNENEVYRLTPLYTLVLTPSTVKKIREYNSQTSYGDYNLICEKDTGEYCKSLYLRGEPDKEGNIIDNNLDQMGVLRRDKSCALNENLSDCMPGDYYERGA